LSARSVQGIAPRAPWTHRVFMTVPR
jgi:hypothetical protein